MKIIERVKVGRRGEGSLIKREGVANWLYAYSFRGHEHEESTKASDLKAARRFVKHKLDEMAVDRQGKGALLAPLVQRLTVDALLDALVADLTLRGAKGLGEVASHLKPLRAQFGAWRAAQVGSGHVDRYIEACLAERLAPATINRRLQLLNQAFRHAHKHSRIAARPYIRHLPEHNARQGFFEADEFARLVAALPGDLVDFVRFGYLTGWRKGEIQTLTWDCVDLAAGVIRLRAQHSKNGKGRAVGMDPELVALMQRREHARLVETTTGDLRVTDYVFHRQGKRVGTFRKAWAKACVDAGLSHVERAAGGKAVTLPDKLFHDLRRTAVRNMVRAGVPERTAMEVSGHRTRAIFDRYDIVNEHDTRNALTLTRSYVAARLSAHSGT